MVNDPNGPNTFTPSFCNWKPFFVNTSHWYFIWHQHHCPFQSFNNKNINVRQQSKVLCYNCCCALPFLEATMYCSKSHKSRHGDYYHMYQTIESIANIAGLLSSSLEKTSTISIIQRAYQHLHRLHLTCTVSKGICVSNNCPILILIILYCIIARTLGTRWRHTLPKLKSSHFCDCKIGVF